MLEERLENPMSVKAAPVVRQTLPLRTAVGAIRLYQRFLSPVLPPACRFYPSCSEYTKTAIERHGLTRGVWLGTKRICKCHPMHPGGIDYVP